MTTITNTTKPSTTLSNASKVSGAETWATIPTTWASETRTWAECVSLFSNTTLENVTFLWAVNSAPWQYLLPWQVTTTGISNTSKPA